jgi:hypothetical protein
VVGLVLAEAVGDLTTEALVHTPYSIVGRIGHPLLGKERVTADDLMSYAGERQRAITSFAVSGCAISLYAKQASITG